MSRTMGRPTIFDNLVNVKSRPAGNRGGSDGQQVSSRFGQRLPTKPDLRKQISGQGDMLFIAQGVLAKTDTLRDSMATYVTSF